MVTFKVSQAMLMVSKVVLNCYLMIVTSLSYKIIMRLANLKILSNTLTVVKAFF